MNGTLLSGKLDQLKEALRQERAGYDRYVGGEK